jgi:hypothetical protein
MTFSVIFLSLAGLFTAAHARKWNERPDRDQFFTEAGVQGSRMRQGPSQRPAHYDPAGNVEGERPF